MQNAPARAAERGNRPAVRSGFSAATTVAGQPDEAQAEFLVLTRLRHGRRLEHQVAARLGLGEGHDLPDVGLEGEERGPAVDADGDPTVRRRAVVEGVEDRTELLAHPLHRVALEQERALEEVAAMDPDRAATELPAVEREVVLEGPGATGRVLGRRLRTGRPTRSRGAARPRARRH